MEFKDLNEEKKLLFLVGLLTFCCGLIYWKVLSFSLIDMIDPQIISSIFEFNSTGKIASLIKSIDGKVIPLTLLVQNVESMIFGLSASTFHLFSFLNHGINIVLAFYLLQLVAPKQKMVNLLILTVFALHPIQTEFVAWVGQRSQVFATSFLLLGFIYYIKFESRIWWSFVFIILCALSDLNMGVWSVGVLGLDLLKTKKFQIDKKHFPFLGVGIVSIGLSLLSSPLEFVDMANGVLFFLKKAFFIVSPEFLHLGRIKIETDFSGAVSIGHYYFLLLLILFVGGLFLNIKDEFTIVLAIIASVVFGKSLNSSLEFYRDSINFWTAQSSFSSHTAYSKYRLGRVYLEDLDKPLDAARVLEEAIELAPQSSDALILLGRAYVRHGDAGSAIDKFKRANALKPSSMNFAWIGSQFKKVFLYDLAEENLVQATKLDPNNAFAWQILVELYEAKNELSKALNAKKILQEIIGS